MVANNPTRVRRVLSDEQMRQIRAAIDDAPTGARSMTVTLKAVFGALLAADGETLADYGPDRPLDPARFVIPKAQWEAICAACVNHERASGAGAQLAVELGLRMPSTYEDPNVTVEPVPAADTLPDAHELTVTQHAVDAIGRASEHCERLRAHFGPISAEYLEAVGSWQRVVSGLFGFGFGARTEVSRDDRLSLFVRTASGFVYGVIFHPVRRRCLREGCGAIITDAGNAWSPRPSGRRCAEGTHLPSYPLDAPSPGVWSTHS